MAGQKKGVRNNDISMLLNLMNPRFQQKNKTRCGISSTTGHTVVNYALQALKR